MLLCLAASHLTLLLLLCSVTAVVKTTKYNPVNEINHYQTPTTSREGGESRGKEGVIQSISGQAAPELTQPPNRQRVVVPRLVQVYD